MITIIIAAFHLFFFFGFLTLQYKYSNLVIVDIINLKAAAIIRKSECPLLVWLLLIDPSSLKFKRALSFVLIYGESQDETPRFLSPWRTPMSSPSSRSRWRSPGISRRPSSWPRGTGHWSSGVRGSQGHVLLQINPFGCSTWFHFWRLAALLNYNIWDDGQEAKRVLRSDKRYRVKKTCYIYVTWGCRVCHSDLGEGCGFDHSQGTFPVDFACKRI